MEHLVSVSFVTKIRKKSNSGFFISQMSWGGYKHLQCESLITWELTFLFGKDKSNKEKRKFAFVWIWQLVLYLDLNDIIFLQIIWKMLSMGLCIEVILKGKLSTNMHRYWNQNLFQWFEFHRFHLLFIRLKTQS